jgi:predicted DNA-binding protein (UPF0251 family)
MKRISPSALTGLFSSLPPSGKRPPPLNMAFLGPVFARGHVFEHEALHHLKGLVENVHGQNAFARFFEYLEADLEKFYNESSWLLESHPERFLENLEGFLRDKLVDEYNSAMARVEKSIYILQERAVAERMLTDIHTNLSGTVDRPADVYGMIMGLKADYVIDDIPYTLPRYIHTAGELLAGTKDESTPTVVCIPDGHCIFEGKPTVIEIKCPVSKHYSAANAASIKNWLKYFIQIAIEIDVTKAEQALFVCWFNKQAKYIVITKHFLTPLLLAVKNFILALGQGEPKTYIEEAYARVPPDVTLAVIGELYTILEVLKAKNLPSSLGEEETAAARKKRRKTLPSGTIWKDELHSPMSNEEVDEYRAQVQPTVAKLVAKARKKMAKPFGFSCRFEVPKGEQDEILAELQALISGVSSPTIKKMLETAANKITANLPVSGETKSSTPSDGNRLVGPMFKMFTR